MRFLKSTRVRIVAAVVFVLVVVFCVMTALLFVFPDLNPPERVRRHRRARGHGRRPFDKGVALARQGMRPTSCCPCSSGRAARRTEAPRRSPAPKVHVNCFKANPQTTQGEARAIERSPQHHWNRIIVVMPTTQATGRGCASAAAIRDRCSRSAYTARGIGDWLAHRLRMGRDVQGGGAAAELLSTEQRHAIATVLRRDRPRRSGDALYRARRGAGWGIRLEGEQCRRASEPSRHVKCRRPTPPLPARPDRGVRRAPRTDAGTRRVPPRAIELVGIALGIGIIAAVALGHQLSNDVFWSLAAGQWMLAHHSVMGLDPFSYTEAHRRWVTDEWGSEVALAGLSGPSATPPTPLYAIVLGGLCLFATAAYARALGARGGRVAAIVLAAGDGDLRRPGGGPRPRLLAGLVAARAAHPDQGARATRAGCGACRCCAWCGSTPTARS